MGDTLAQDCFPMPEPFLGAQQFRGELIEVGSTKVLEFAPFEQIPDSHLGIEFGGVARQSFQMNASGSSSCQKILDGPRAMNARAIPNDQQLARKLAQEQVQEPHDIRAFERVVLEVHNQASIHGQAADGRKMIARQGDFQNGRFSHGSIGAYRHGQQVKARLIYKHDRAFLLFGLFFNSTEWWSRHTWMACSSRWRARVSGFCRLCLIAERRREQWVG